MEVEEAYANAQVRKMIHLLQIRKEAQHLTAEINLNEDNGLVVVSGNHDEFHTIIAVNNKAERIFGYHYDEVVGQDLVNL